MGIIKTEQEMLLLNSLQGLHLLEKADHLTVAEDLLGIQSQFSGYAQQSLQIRALNYSQQDWGQGLVKIWSHRGTMHLVSQRTLTLHLAAAGFGREFSDGAWLISKGEAEHWAPFIVEQIRRGNCTREGLKQACRQNGMNGSMMERAFYGWGGLIYEMTYRGMIAGVPGGKKEYMLPKVEDVWPERDAAREEMIRTYFDHFGPATLADCKYFFGRWKAAEMDPILNRMIPELQKTVIGKKSYYSAKPLLMEGVIPDCVLVPGFDQLVLGYKERDRMLLPEHKKKLTNQAGIVFPSVIVRNRIRARWKLESNKMTVIPFEKLLKKDETAILRKARATFGKQINPIITDPE